MLTVNSDSRNLLELSRIADETFAERLQTIPGVSGIDIWGDQTYAMRLWLDPHRLAAYQLSPMDVRDAVQRENVELPSGRIEGREVELTVRTMSRLNTPEEFEDLIVKESGGRVVRFRDVGRVELGPQNERTVLKSGGVPMVAVVLRPLPGANYIEIADEYYRRIAQIRRELPPDINLDFGFDASRYVRQSVAEVQQTIFPGLPAGPRRHLRIPTRVAHDPHPGRSDPRVVDRLFLPDARRRLLPERPDAAGDRARHRSGRRRRDRRAREHLLEDRSRPARNRGRHGRDPGDLLRRHRHDHRARGGAAAAALPRRTHGAALHRVRSHARRRRRHLVLRRTDADADAQHATVRRPHRAFALLCVERAVLQTPGERLPGQPDQPLEATLAGFPDHRHLHRPDRPLRQHPAC